MIDDLQEQTGNNQEMEKIQLLIHGSEFLEKYMFSMIPMKVDMIVPTEMRISDFKSLVLTEL